MDNYDEPQEPKETPYQKGRRHQRETYARNDLSAATKQLRAEQRAQEALAAGEFTPVLVDTGAARTSGQQNRIAVKDPSTTASRQSQTAIPKRLEALYILFADSRELGGAVLTREELDINPRTKVLAPKDKDALVKYWPQFQTNLAKAREIRELREEETALALKAEKGAVALRKKHDLDSKPISDQLDATARVFHNQVFKSSLAVAATDVEDIHSDPLSRELYKLRISYVKDFIWIARNLVDLADRIRATDNASIADGILDDETRALLHQADTMLLGKGVKTFEYINVE